MKESGKIIKYIAVALAVFIIFTIVSGVIFLVSISINVFDGKEKSEDLNEIEITDNIKNLNIDILTTKLIIKKGEKFTFETNNEHIKSDKGSNKLYIKEETHNVLFKNTNYELIIYIPEDMNFDEVYVQSSSGNISIDKLVTNKLELDLGAGNVLINDLNVSEKASVDGGAGEIVISNGSINNLDLDMGVGNLDLSSKLLGNNEIDAGVGNVNINLLGNDYKISVDKGLGKTTINDEKIKDNTIIGFGVNELNIDGGVGNISVITENISNSLYQFEMSVDRYLKNDSNELIVIGTVLNGKMNKNSEVELISSNNELIMKAKINSKNPGIYEKDLDDVRVNDKIAVIIDGVSEEALKKTAKIIVR